MGGSPYPKQTQSSEKYMSPHNQANMKISNFFNKNICVVVPTQYDARNVPIESSAVPSSKFANIKK